VICIRPRAPHVVDRFGLGDRQACGLDPAATPVERAVVAAFESAQPLLLNWLQDERAAAEAALERRDAHPQSAVREAWMTEAFFGVMLPRLDSALRDEGLSCGDCPSPVDPPRRDVSWAELQPYLAAYVWPDPVQTPRDASGRPTGKPKVSGHICAGINGVDELDDPDPVLLRVAFLLVLNTPKLHARAPAVLHELADDSTFDDAPTDEARTAYLREELGPRLFSSEDVRAALCTTADRFQTDTGVVVRGCPRVALVGSRSPG
jgi:hypothetical protein